MEASTEKSIQEQILALDKKLDMVLEEVHAQKQSRQVVEDLVSDLSLIGTDFVKSTTIDLDNAGLDVDGDSVKRLAFNFIRNIDTFNDLFGMMESANDLMKDLTPIVQQVGLDTIQKFNEFDQKGYFEFINELGNLMDNVLTHFTKDDVKMLSENIVTILETVKSLTQPDMLKAVDNGIAVYKNIDMDNIPEYSIWKAMKEMNSPEMKKGIGFMITFLKNIASETNK
jgi:uncharacterized protein YjgD (DUF1641 family)